MALPRKLVVAGLITGPRGILITKRPEGSSLGGKWEFPGGKIEPGESPVSALIRELREEIGCEVEVFRVWDVLHHNYPTFELLMLVYHCSKVPGQEPQCREVVEFAWVSPEQMTGFDILEADLPLVQRLREEGVPTAEGLRPTLGRN